MLHVLQVNILVQAGVDVLHVLQVNIQQQVQAVALLVQANGLIVRHVMLRHVLPVQADTKFKAVLVYKIY